MKTRLILTVMLTLVLGSMLIASVAACPVEAHGCKPFRRMPLNCRLYIELNWEVFTDPTVPSWIGKVRGDIKGDLYVYLVESSIEGDTEYFSEEWRIETKAGVIEGVDEGVWSLTTLEWVAEGEVTAATGKWNYLVGYNMRYGGKVTPNPFEVDPGTKIIGRGTLTIWRVRAPLRCELSIILNETLPGWEGTVSGDIEGSYVWILKESTVEGTTEYYLGTWVIETDCGSISGFDAGVFSYETLEWVAFGRVTAATGKWSYLVGSFMWNSGTATLGEVVTGEGKLTILPCWHW